MQHAANQIGFLIGLLISFFLYKLFKGGFSKYGTSKLYEWANNWRYGQLGFLYNHWNKFFEGRFPNGVPYGTTFKYYGGTWMLRGESKLYWIHKNFTGQHGDGPEYQSHWNYARNDFKSMMYIMQNHPNLREARMNLKPEDYKPIIIEPFQSK